MRILVADDLPSVRKVIKKLLARVGHPEVIEASNGKQALEIFQKEPCDLIISDWQMPQMNGLELLKQIRLCPNGEKTPILFVTSENDKAQVLSAIQAGVAGYLCKPFSSDLLLEKLAQFFGTKSDT